MLVESTIGSTLAGYRIESLVGRGGMGEVYCARHLHLDRRVALKILAPALADNEDFRRRFIRESRAAGSLRHPNIVTVYDAGEADGRLYIAMQLVEGTDLATLLRDRRLLESGETLWIVRQIASALDAAHASGLVHRDVKPANVMIDEGGAYLTDFGLTKRTTVSDRGSTAAGRFLGTVDYAAPEQISGRELDGRTDVYALGCVLYQCLTGCVPFPRESEIAVLFSHVHDPPPLVTARRPDLPPAVDRVVQHALEKRKEDRPANCGSLVAQAAAALELEQPRDEPEPGLHPAGIRRGRASGASERETSPLAPPMARGRRLRPRAAMAVVAVAAASAVAALLLTSGRDDTDDSRGPPAPTAAAPREAGKAAPAVAARKPKVRVARVGRRPFGIGASSDGIWVANVEDDQVRRLDPRAGRPLGDPVNVGDGPFWVVLAANRVWVANVRSRSVTRIDPTTGDVLDMAIPVGRGPSGIAAGPGTVWVANEEDDTVTPIPTATPAAPRPAFRVCDRPRGLATSPGMLWVACRREGSVVRVDTRTLERIGDPIKVGRDPQGVVVARGRVFVSNSDDDTVTRISVETGEVLGRPTRVGRAPYGIAFGEGQIWVANSGSDSVTRLDPRTGRRVGKPIPVGDQPVGVHAGSRAVWVTNNDDGTVARITP